MRNSIPNKTLEKCQLLFEKLNTHRRKKKEGKKKKQGEKNVKGIFEWKGARERKVTGFSRRVWRPTRTSQTTAGPIYTLRRMVTQKKKLPAHLFFFLSTSAI
jgi:hypothetical protein